MKVNHEIRYDHECLNGLNMRFANIIFNFIYKHKKCMHVLCTNL